MGKTTVSIADRTLSVKGSKGTLTKQVHSSIDIVIAPEGISVTTNDHSRLSTALVGTFASHVKNMIQGVETPYTRKLILEGIGYRIELKKGNVVLTVGFSHVVELPIPENVSATVEKNTIMLTSPDKEAVGQFAANIRHVKPPEPYLGKGIHYEGEIVRRKQGKKAT